MFTCSTCHENLSNCGDKYEILLLSHSIHLLTSNQKIRFFQTSSWIDFNAYLYFVSIFVCVCNCFCLWSSEYVCIESHFSHSIQTYGFNIKFCLYRWYDKYTSDNCYFCQFLRGMLLYHIFCFILLYLLSILSYVFRDGWWILIRKNSIQFMWICFVIEISCSKHSAVNMFL